MYQYVDSSSKRGKKEKKKAVMESLNLGIKDL